MYHLSNFKIAVRKTGIHLYKIIPATWQNSIDIMRLRMRLISRVNHKYLPSSIYLETTSACNLNCIMCPAQRPLTKKYKKEGFMESHLFRQLIDEVASHNPMIDVRLHKDGEPLLHPEIGNFIEYASSKLPNVNLVTNGTLLNEEISRTILKTRLKSIRFSIDGCTKQTFEKVRRQDRKNPYADSDVPIDYESVIGNILRFCELKKNLGKEFPKVGVRITDFKATKNEIEEFSSYWRERADFMEISPLLSWSGQITQENGDQSQRYPCLNLWEQLVINWDGTMAPCCIYVNTTDDGKGILADFKTNALREAFYSPRMQRVRLAHINNDLADAAPFCKLCNDWRLPSPPGDKVWTEKFKDRMRFKLVFDIA